MRCKSRYEQILFASKRAAESTEIAAACAVADEVILVVVLAVPAGSFTFILRFDFKPAPTPLDF